MIAIGWLLGNSGVNVLGWGSRTWCKGQVASIRALDAVWWKAQRQQAPTVLEVCE